MMNSALSLIAVGTTVASCAATAGALPASNIADVNANNNDFLWGSATASYQVEGAFREDGRGMTVWDKFSHTPGKVTNGDNGDIADDHYHRFAEDIEMMKKMGLKSYRFSIAWSRILPSGRGEINTKGIDHYNAVIDALVEADITPFVTLFHWDTPLALETEVGGWLNPDMEEYFKAYANVCFKSFGDRVQHWLTFNEPISVARGGYMYGTNAPGRCSDRTKCTEGNSSTEPYIVSHNMLNAHAAAVELYRSNYQSKQAGVIGITLNSDFAYPLTTDSVEDQKACQRNLEFQTAWYADPVYFGDYPASMKELVGDRLPSFTDEQKQRLKGSQDFYGLNHYTSKYVSNMENPPSQTDSTGWDQDQHTVVSATDLNGDLIGPQAASEWLNVVPKGIEDLLYWLNDRYHPSAIYITENGVDVPGEAEMTKNDALNDQFRIDYYSSYLDHALAARKNGVPLVGYFAWSLMDNFEWADGYDYRFGLVHVEFDGELERTPKNSAEWYSNYTQYHP